MAFFGSSWNEDIYSYKSEEREITKDDVIKFLKKHPEVLDEVIVMSRNLKINKIKKNGNKI